MTNVGHKLVLFLKKDPVFTIAAGLAVLSMAVVPPSPAYLGYFDFAVLGTLFCLMCVVAGFRRCGLLDAVSHRLLASARSLRGISLLLVCLCFVSSMLLTNDVALIAFVPLTLVALQSLPPMQMIYLVVLETMAANLGSMLTPVGNPQNLYLYAYYQMHLGEFMATVAPVCIFSLLLLLGLVAVGKSQPLSPAAGQAAVPLDKKALWLHLALFLLCILTVLRVVDYRLCTLVTLLVLLTLDRSLLARVDYMLLGTFMAFFVLVGNLGALDSVRTTISTLMQGRELLTAVVVSQVISNVPAAIMLSRFTSEGGALLLGCNLGGLGTLVASLASLISYKLYAKSPGARPLLYLGVFTLLNVGMLLLLGLFTWLLL